MELKVGVTLKWGRGRVWGWARSGAGGGGKTEVGMGRLWGRKGAGGVDARGSEAGSPFCRGGHIVGSQAVGM